MSKEYFLAYARDINGHRDYYVFPDRSEFVLSPGGNAPRHIVWRDALMLFSREEFRDMCGTSLKLWTAQCCKITPTKTGFSFKLIGKPFEIE